MKLLSLLLLSLSGSFLCAQTSLQHGTGAPAASNCSASRMYGRVYMDVSVSPPVTYSCGSSGWGILNSTNSIPGVVDYPANQPVSGCKIEYISGLIFNVGACTYTIGGVQYTSTLTQITLNAADGSNPRIDILAVDNTGTAIKITGTAAASPAQPSVDYSTQLPLNLVLVGAMATTPTGIAATSIYEENTEWTSTCNTNFNCASTTNPYRGTKDIEATTAVLGNNFTLVKPAAGTVDLSTQNTLTLYIRSKATWPTANNTGTNGLRTLSLFWLSGSTQVGLQVVIRSGSFGFDSSITTAYQQVVIPISLFGTGSTTVTTLKGQITGNGGTSSIGFYIDGVSLQSGTAPISLPTTLMNFKGAWNTTSNYNVNDVVSSNNCGYVALAINTNIALTVTTTWQKLCGTQTIVSGAKALATGAISSAACTAAQTDTATGTLTTDAITVSFNGDPTAVTGYVPLTTGMLTIIPYPTADTVNFKVCNNTNASITPGAITLNWRVTR